MSKRSRKKSEQLECAEGFGVRLKETREGALDHRRLRMETVDEALSNRVDAAIQAHKRAVLSTSGPTTAIAELVTRLEGLEKAIREVALEVEKLTLRA
jgi:hypothetical protein